MTAVQEIAEASEDDDDTLKTEHDGDSDDGGSEELKVSKESKRTVISPDRSKLQGKNCPSQPITNMSFRKLHTSQTSKFGMNFGNSTKLRGNPS